MDRHTPQNRHAPIRIVIVNPVWHEGDATAASALDRFSTLTGWARAIQAQGASVMVIQRFHTAETTSRDGIDYRCVADGAPARPGPAFRGGAALDAAIVDARPSLVHINGMDFPRLIRRIRRHLPTAAIAVQDHGGFDPRQLSPLRRGWIRRGLAAADVLLTATPAQADSFRASGVVPETTAARDVMESSTDLRVERPAVAARSIENILFVGRLNANKDPLTVLDGFSRFAQRAAGATLTFVYGDAALESRVREAVTRLGALGTRVTLAGAVPHASLTRYYAAADAFVLGSHREGSGYAALEALACGVVPVLTSIPAFRGLTDDGRLGGLWECGDAASLAAALDRVASAPLDPQRRACREWFEERYSWPALGRRAMTIYREFSVR